MIKAISRLVPAGFLYKAIPSFWKKSLVVIGLLAALIAVFVVFTGLETKTRQEQRNVDYYVPIPKAKAKE